MSSEAEAWARLGDLLHRRLESKDAGEDDRLNTYASIPTEKGVPDQSHPAFPSFAGGYQLQLEYLKQNPAQLNPDAGSPVRRSAGVSAWINEVQFVVRGASSTDRGYLLRIPNPDAETVPNEASDPSQFHACLVMGATSQERPVIQLLTGSTERETFRAVLSGPKNSFGREIQLWARSEEIGASLIWPMRSPLDLEAAWHLIAPESFPNHALPWQYGNLPPVRWTFSAIRDDDQSPWTATVEVYPGIEWESDFTVALGSGDAPLAQKAIPLAENLPEDPIQWSIGGKSIVRMEGREHDLTVPTASALLASFPLIKLLEGIERWLRAIAHEDRQSHFPSSIGVLNCSFNGGPFEQIGNGLIGNEWRLRLKASPLFQVSEQVNFVPWFAENEKPAGAFLQWIIRMHDEHTQESRLGIQLRVQGQIALDWRFRSSRPGKAEASGKAEGRVDLLVQGTSSRDFDTVVLYAGPSDESASDQPGICGEIHADSERDDSGAFQPRVLGQFRWKGLALYGGYVSRAGVRTGDPEWLDDESMPESVQLISTPMAWPVDAGKAAPFFN